MKKAVAYLIPFMDAEKAALAASDEGASTISRSFIIIVYYLQGIRNNLHGFFLNE